MHITYQLRILQAIRNAAAQNEHLLLRNLNLQLMEDYAPEMYLKFNKRLEDLLHHEEKYLRKVFLKLQILLSSYDLLIV